MLTPGFFVYSKTSPVQERTLFLLFICRVKTPLSNLKIHTCNRFRKPPNAINYMGVSFVKINSFSSDLIVQITIMYID